MDGYLLDHAGIDWRDELTPVSARYGDIYWSGGIEEKRHVFVAGNRIPERFAATEGSFVVGEIGFGFGLNFLLTATAWRENTRRGRLHYVAIDRHPVAADQLSKLYGRILNGRTRTFGERLISQYPLPTPGAHTRWIDDDICLTLVFGDVGTVLDNMVLTADAWYLDGFSPSLNPDVWNDKVYRQLADRSRPGTTLATYAVAGHVRRGLTTAGFRIERRPGYGNKAEMLAAELPGRQRLRDEPECPERVTVIGAGMAGLFCARALARRGIEVSIVEAASAPLAGASCIRQMAVYPQLALQPGPWNHFSLSAFQHLCTDEPAFNATGFAMLADTQAQQERLARLATAFDDDFMEYGDARRLTEVTGLTLDQPGAIFHTAGWLDMAHAFDTLSGQGDIRTGTSVADLNPTDGGWQLLDAAGRVIHEAEQVIIATGAGAFPLLDPIPAAPVRGQSLTLKVPPGRIPATVLSGPVTLFPAKDGLCTLSATYSPKDADLAVREKDTLELIQRLQEVLPGDDYQVESAAVGLRKAPRDRMPVIGPLPDWRAPVTGRGQRGRRASFDHYLAGLYVCNGFGSHGATHAKLGAEYLAALLCHEPLPLTRDWARLLSPDRFPATSF